jgi:hypothetical protein
VYIKRTAEIELVAKEEELGWFTVIPMVNGVQQLTFKCKGLEQVIRAAEKRFGLKDLSIDDFEVKLESTNFNYVN